MVGPLHTLRVIEFEGIGPGPLAGMILADMGAEVTVIRRKGGGGLASQLGGGKGDILNRGKHIVTLDLKHPEGLALILDLLTSADALIEGNRPGVMERLGLGPEVVHARNPKLIYGRMTGWGQTGLLAPTAGHDLNYIALTGLLGMGGGRLPPQRPPATLTGDAIGALGLAFGIVAAAFEAKTSGKGQVVDAAIVDIAALLGTLATWIYNNGQIGASGPNALPSVFYDSPFYDIFECADGQWLTIGPLEPQFYALMLSKLELTDVAPNSQYDTRQWPALKARLSVLFKSQPRAHWDALLTGTDVCYAPVLTPTEAAAHPHNVAREVFRTEPVLQANPAPRFSRTPGEIRQVGAGETAPALSAIDASRLANLREQGVLK
ncbi:MAG: CoA transferase [Rhodocyclaceae bacterium]|nr:CoA transferase [Rhodocyclaceae bacterium]